MTCTLRLYRNACLAAAREVQVKEPGTGNEGGKGKKLRNKRNKNWITDN